MPTGFTLNELIACVDREISMRERNYPRWIQAGHMTQFKADREIALMRAVRLNLVAQRNLAVPKQSSLF